MEFQYSIDGSVLDTDHVMRDLGIFVDDKLSFLQHIDYCTAKGLKMLGFIKRHSVEFKQPNTLRLLYIALVRPILMYCSQVWSPHYASHIKKLERVQHRFLSWAAIKLGLPNPRLSHDYSQIAAVLNISSLKSHHEAQDVLFLYKIVNRIITCPPLLESVHLHVPSNYLRSLRSSTDPADVFHAYISRSTFGKHSPISRITRIANEIDKKGLTVFGPSYSGFYASVRSHFLVDFS